MDNTKNTAIDPFVNWAHSFGRIFSLVIVIYMFAMPTIYCAIYDCFPSVKDVVTGTLPIAMMMWPGALSECLSYSPILGSSSYLSFVTGNVMNLKLPCAINAQKMVDAQPNTPRGDAACLLANSISSITTMLIIVLGMILMIPLRPVLQSPFFTTAATYMLPAIFGCLVLGFLTQDKRGTWIKNRLLIPVPSVIMALVLYLTWKMAFQMQGVLVIVSIIISIIFARILWKSGVVKVVKGPEGTPVD